MGQRATTYRAVQAVAPASLNLCRTPLKPPPGHVRIRVEACGVCHSDSATVEGILPIQWPRVPGHEAVGRIDAIGEDGQGGPLGSESVLASSAVAVGTVSTAATAISSTARTRVIPAFSRTAAMPSR